MKDDLSKYEVIENLNYKLKKSEIKSGIILKTVKY